MCDRGGLIVWEARGRGGGEERARVARDIGHYIVIGGWELGIDCGRMARVVMRVSPRWHWQVFTGRRLVTRLLLASSDLSTIKALHQELTKLVTDMQVCVTYCVSVSNGVHEWRSCACRPTSSGHMCGPRCECCDEHIAERPARCVCAWGCMGCMVHGPWSMVHSECLGCVEWGTW